MYGWLDGPSPRYFASFDTHEERKEQQELWTKHDHPRLGLRSNHRSTQTQFFFIWTVKAQHLEKKINIKEKINIIKMYYVLVEFDLGKKTRHVSELFFNS